MERIPCSHKGTYADDCICDRVRQHKCYIVATCDRDLRRRIRKVSMQVAHEVGALYAIGTTTFSTSGIFVFLVELVCATVCCFELC